MVHELGVRLELLHWELQVQITGLIENLRPQGIFIRVRSPRGPHLSTKTQLYPTANKLQCWKPQAKQPIRQEHNPTHKKEKKKMRWQKNMSQMKKQSKNLQDQTNEEEIGSLPEKEFRLMIVKIFQNPGNRMKKIQETFNKDLEEPKSKQIMMKNTISC